jgi:hypothetical protein
MDKSANCSKTKNPADRKKALAKAIRRVFPYKKPKTAEFREESLPYELPYELPYISHYTYAQESRSQQE